MINIVMFLVASVCASLINSNLASNKLNDHEEFASYISRNFASFRKEATIETGQEITANGISEIKTVTIVNGKSKEKGSLLIFNDLSGYLLVGNGQKLFDYDFNKVPSFETSDGGLEYYVDSDCYNLPTVIESNIADVSMSSAYNGQERSGCGTITNANGYMNSRFGSGWSCVSAKSLAMQPFNQHALSCYLRTDLNNPLITYSEANCGMVSAYHVLQFLQSSKGYRNMPGYNQTWYYYDPYIYEPSEYFKRFTNNGEQKYQNCTLNDSENLGKFPELYKVTRQISVDELNKIEDLTVFETESLIKKVMSYYNHSLTTSVNVLWKMALDEAMGKIDSGETLCFSLLSDETYGSHTMAVCGYEKYQKTSRFLWFNNIETKVLFELCDGWANETRFYDVTTSTTLGSFVFLEF